jgi:hypothetical protein
LVARIQRDEALKENAEMRAIIHEVSNGGYTPMQAHEWLKSHSENAAGLAPMPGQDVENTLNNQSK